MFPILIQRLAIRLLHTMLLLMGQLCCVWAQQYPLVHYGIEEGLGSSMVHTLYQDSEGYIWISTEAGIVRFDGQTFKQYSQKDGASVTRITNIKEDAQGRLWFKSRLARDKADLMLFDGRKFHTIPKDSLRVHGTKVGGVLAYRDQYEPLWLEHPRGILPITNEPMRQDQAHIGNSSPFNFNYIYDDGPSLDGHPDVHYFATIKGLVVHEEWTYRNLTKEQGKYIQIHQMSRFSEQESRYWLITDEGLQFFDGEELSNAGIPEELHRNVVHNMAQDSEGTIWLATLLGLYRYRAEEGFQLFTKADGLPANRINHLFIDSRDRLWLSTDPALVVYDQERFTIIDRSDKHNPLSSASSSFMRRFGLTYRQVLEDHEGGIWFNTKDGIAKFNSFAFQHYRKDAPLSGETITSVCKSEEGLLLVGYSDAGLDVCKGDSCRSIKKSDKMGLRTNAVNDLVLAPNGESWVATAEGVLRYRPSDGRLIPHQELERNAYVYFTKDKQQNKLWAIAQDTLLLFDEQGLEGVYPMSNGSSHLYRSRACVDANGKLWLPGMEGLYAFNTEKNSVELVAHADYVGVPVAMDSDAQGNIWLTNLQGGLYRFDGKNLIAFDELDGLVSENIRSIVVHGDYAYIGTVSGIDRINVAAFNKDKRVEIEHLGAKDGFTPLECSLVAKVLDRDQIWFGHREGGSVFDPAAHSPNERRPLPHIHRVELNHEAVDWAAYAEALDPRSGLPTEVVLEPHENTLSFYFDAVSFVDPNRNNSAQDQQQYQYWLEGYEEEWKRVKTHASVTYGDLPSGQYTFWLKPIKDEQEELPVNARSSDTTTALPPHRAPLEMASFSFLIEAPVYHHAWFWGYLLLFFGCVFLLTYLVLGFVKWRALKRRAQSLG